MYSFLEFQSHPHHLKVSKYDHYFEACKVIWDHVFTRYCATLKMLRWERGAFIQDSTVYSYVLILFGYYTMTENMSLESTC